MAKELYDGIYSSHKLVFIEKVKKNLNFYLKDKINDLKILGQEIYCRTDIKNLHSVLKEIKENPELEVGILNSINKYISDNKCYVLLNLSSLSNNFSMLIKVCLAGSAYEKESFTVNYNELLVKISDLFDSAIFYLEDSAIKDHYSDIVVKARITDGLDTFDTYLQAENDLITKATISTRVSVVPLYSATRDISVTDLITNISRFDYNAGIFPELCFCLALEEIMQLKVCKRVQFIRMIISELFRISSHLNYITNMAGMLGSALCTNKALIELEVVLRIIELITGSRVHPNYIRIGGVKKDLSREKIKNISSRLPLLYKNITSLEAMLLDNTIITSKLKNTGVADRQTVLDCGVTGPNLRASGGRYDLRKNRNLLLYKDASFLVVTGKYGDSLERLYIRFREIYQSLKIIDQLVNSMPEEHIKKLINLSELEMPFTEMISSIECPHGVFKIFFEIDGNKVLRLVIMGPSRNSLYLAESILCGCKTDDAEIVLASLDISSGEIMQELPL